MGGANNVRTILRQETIGLPVHRMAEMHAEVVVGKYLVSLPYDETLERPVAPSNTKLSRVGISQLIEAAN